MTIHGIPSGLGGQIGRIGQIGQIGQPQGGQLGQLGPNFGPNPVQALAGGMQVFPQGTVEALGGLNPQVVVQPQPQPQPLPFNAALINMSLTPDGPQAAVQMPLAGVGGLNPHEAVRMKAAEGRQLLQGILQGNPPPQNLENAAKLMWFMQALGSSKASLSSGGDNIPAMYKAGALMLEDPHERLETWLNGPDSYDRPSSHLHGFQNAGAPFQPRGLDVRGVETPHNRRTILFQRLPRQGEAPPGAPHTGNTRLLYFKMEEHGCRGLVSFRGRHRGVFGGIKNFFSNAGDFLGHAFGFAKSLGRHAGLVAITGQENRESIPSRLKSQYKMLLQAGAGDPQLAALLGRDNPLSDARGIRQMKLNIDEAVISGLLEAENPLVVAFRMQLAQRDHLNLRIGNEVILLADELPQP